MIQGDIVSGKLRIVRRIGVGGMGAVYEARHLALDRRVAVKVLHPDCADSTSARARFMREGRALAQLPSDHIVQVLDVDTLAEGEPYMVMEYLEGRDLKRELRKRGPLPVAEAVGYLIQACAGIAVAHDAGIVHRDIKPANIFISNLDGERRVKVIDFGVARFTASADQDLTAPSDLPGTTSYMAPEQLMGADANARSDVWALGVALFEILTGSSPFRGQTSQHTVAAVLTASPTSLHEARSDVPLALAQVVTRCLEKVPAQRFADARELASALAPFGPREAVVRPSLRAARGSSLPPPEERIAEKPPQRPLAPAMVSASPSPEAMTLTDVFAPFRAPLPQVDARSTVPTPALRRRREQSSSQQNADSPASSRWRRSALPIAGFALLGVALAVCLSLVLRPAEAPAVARPHLSAATAATPGFAAARAPAAETATESAPAGSAPQPPSSAAAQRPPVAAQLPGKSARVTPPRTSATQPLLPPPAPPAASAGRGAVPLHL